MYYIAVIASAVQALFGWCKSSGNDTGGVFAMDVFSFMKDVASESPIMQCVFYEIRFA